MELDICPEGFFRFGQPQGLDRAAIAFGGGHWARFFYTDPAQGGATALGEGARRWAVGTMWKEAELSEAGAPGTKPRVNRTGPKDICGDSRLLTATKAIPIRVDSSEPALAKDGCTIMQLNRRVFWGWLDACQC